MSSKYVDISTTESYINSHKRPKNNNGLASEHRYMGQPRLACHKLNKKQFKSGCGYKEVSVRPLGLGFAKDKVNMEVSSNRTSVPIYGVKTFKRHSGK